MASSLSDFDAQLLNLVQRELPLVPRPFDELARRLGCPQQQVLDRLSALRSPPNPVIRQIGAIFDTKALGYRSSLIAARVDVARIEQAAAALSEHPGVTHNYERNHPFNLWYTLAVPPDSRLGLEKTVDILHRRSGAISTRLFPTLKLYKIGVSFDLSGESDAAARGESAGFSDEDREKAMRFSITDADKRMIRVLQQDLPISPQPFDDWARQAGVSVDQLLAAAEGYKKTSRMRRFAALLHHRAAGAKANAMGAWAVPAEKQDAFGALAASFAAVSHCYLRPTYEDWPYCIFTMIHGVSEDDCNATLRAISEASGARSYLALYSSREFKKTRLKYFAGDIEAWEAGA
jgi:siroheme decarboxylase